MSLSLPKKHVPNLVRCSLVILLFTISSQVFATHFRYGNITWSKDVSNPRLIHFKVTQSWRRGFNWKSYDASNPTNPNVGAMIKMGINAPFHTGYGTFTTPVILTVTSISTTDDWIYGEFDYDYTYPATGTYVAYFESCCRLSSPTANPPGKLQNNGDGSFRVETQVTVGNNNDAPVSTLPPFINMITGLAAATYKIPGTDPNGDALTFSLAPPASFTQSGNSPNTQPTGFAVSSAGLITFNTVGKAIGNLYNGVVRITDSKGAYIDLDFLIKIVAPSNPPQYDYSPGNTPANNNVFTIAPGQNLSFIVKAKDPDVGDSVTLFGSGIPVGAVLTPGLPTIGAVNASVQTTFSWTPTSTQIGSYVVNFIAQDPQGVQTPTSVTIVVACNNTVTSITGSQFLCFNTTGFLTVSATGTSPFQYSSDNGVTFSTSSANPFTFSNLSGGTYNIVAKGANGCASAPVKIILTATDQIALSNAPAIKQVTCNGALNGEITLSAHGGFAYLTYTLDGGTLNGSQNNYTGIFTGLGAGIYNYSITDVNNCTPVTGSVTINEPDALTATIGSQTNVDCNGNSTGSVTVSGVGGTAPYSYSIDGNDFSNASGTFSSLTSGGYTITVKDANGCTGTVPVTITQPAQLTANITEGHIACNGGTTTLTITASGGTPPYSNDGVHNVGAGDYSFTIKDANNCSYQVSGTISQPTPLTATVKEGAITCNGGTTTVTITASGGTPPYSNDGVHNVGAGDYSFTVKDANNCSYQVSGTISQPTPLTATVKEGAITCNGGTTTVTITASGGTAPYSGDGVHNVGAGDYSFTIKDANNCSYQVGGTISQPTPLTATVKEGAITCNGGTTTVTITASGGTPPYSNDGVHNVGAGDYSFTVKDANNCSYQVSGTISQPTPLTATVKEGAITCNGGTTTVTITASGGTAPYSNDGIHNVGAGAYSFTVKDANNCSYQVSGTISQPTPLTATVKEGAITCNGGTTTVTITASGGTAPYSGDGVHNVGAGAYSFTVKDANNCSYQVSGTISQPTPLTATVKEGAITCNGGTTTVTITASGGTPPYSNDGVHNVSAGDYSFTVKDANNCSYQVSGTISQPTPLTATVKEGAITCNGGTTTVTITASGGTPPYSNDGVHNVGAGDYSFTVKDANNCSYQVSGTISQPTPLTATVKEGAITCNGGTTTVTITASGGTAPYSNDGIHNVGAGAYSFTVKDANNCSYQVSGTISQPTPLMATVKEGTIACHSGTTTVVITPSGGTSPYTNAGAHTVSAGAYSFTISDAIGCTATVQGTISEPPQLVSTCSTNNPDLWFGYTGDQTATITAKPSGGRAPYRILITMSRPLKCNSINDAGDEIWMAGTGTSNSINITCPASPASATAAPVSIANSIGSGSSYSVTVTLMSDADFIAVITDANGCISTCTTHIHAEDIRCFAGNSSNQKIAVCHKTGSSNNPCVQICIDKSALAEHLAHGDFVGKCTANCKAPATTISSKNAIVASQDNSSGDETSTIKVLPNPNNGQFTLELNNFKVKKAEILILNVNGSVLEKRQLQLVGKGQTLDFDLKNKSAGIYIVKVVSVKGVQTAKVIVQK